MLAWAIHVSSAAKARGLCDYQTRGVSDDGGLAVLRMTDVLGGSRREVVDYGLELELLRSKTSQETPARVAVDRHHHWSVRFPTVRSPPKRQSWYCAN